MQKDDENKIQLAREAMADKAKPRCRVCGKYADKKTSPQCFGHGGGSGSSDSSSESSSTRKDRGLDNSDNKTTAAPNPSVEVNTGSAVELSYGFKHQFDGKPFNDEMISELLSARLLLIDNNSELGTLTIKLLCNAKDLSLEQRNEFNNFVNEILKELEEFKIENDLSQNCKLIEQDKEGNILSLRIALPTLQLYDDFIKRLASKKLLPVQNIQQNEERVVYPEKLNHFNVVPFSMQPTPATKRGVDEENSAIRPKSPLDGLKPN